MNSLFMYILEDKTCNCLGPDIGDGRRHWQEGQVSIRPSGDSTQHRLPPPSTTAATSSEAAEKVNAPDINMTDNETADSLGGSRLIRG